MAGLDALALAEKLDLHELASDVITTLSNLKKAGPKDALRSALVEAVHRAVDSGAILAELRARYFLGRSYEDWAEWAQAETWFRSAMKAADRRGHPLRAVGLRVPVAAGVDQDRRRRLGRGAAADRHQRRTRAADPVGAGRGRRAAGRVRPRRAGGRAGPGAAPVLGARGRGRHQLRRRGDGRGRARSDDPTKVIAVYQDAVAVLSRIWHEWFSARHPAGRDHDRRGRRLDAAAQRRRAGGPAGRGRAPARRGPHGAQQVLRPLAASGVPRAAPG